MSAWSWLSILLTSAVASAAAYNLAIRKGRPERAGKWATLSFLLPLALPFQTLQRSRKNPQAHPQWFSIPLIIVANLAVVGQLVVAFDEAASAGTIDGLPTCGSKVATDTAKSAIAGGPMGRTVGLSIIDLSGVQEISSSALERRCTGKALLNSGVEQTATYKMYYREGNSSQFFLNIEVN